MNYSSSFAPQPLAKVSKKEGKKKYTKADIGPPCDFRHVSHVGWDPNKGFDLEKADDPHLKVFLEQVKYEFNDKLITNVLQKSLNC